MTTYQPTAILLTGGAGFIGSHTLCHLVETYPDTPIVCLDKVTVCANTKNFESVLDRPNFTFIKGDITSVDLVHHIFQKYNIDTVLHFAAETHVDNSFGQSLVFTTTNVLGTHVLLEAAKARLPHFRRFIHVSTDEVYGEGHHQQRSTVDDKLAPTNPYAASKAAAEFLVQSYATSFQLPIIITRGNNVYGPRQYPEKLIPKFISLLNRGDTCCLHGDGSNRRSFLHVTDVAKAFACILQRGVLGTVYNVGSTEEFTNRSVLDRLLKLFDLPAGSHTRFVRDRAFNDLRYSIDTSSLRAIGWKQTIAFETGLRTTKAWYLAHPDYWPHLEQALQAHPCP